MDDADNAVAVARRQTFFRRGQLLHGKAGINERLVLRMAGSNGDRELRFRQRVGDLPQIAADEEILLDEFS